jgi:hypothetical protein
VNEGGLSRWDPRGIALALLLVSCTRQGPDVEQASVASPWIPGKAGEAIPWVPEGSLDTPNLTVWVDYRSPRAKFLLDEAKRADPSGFNRRFIAPPSDPKAARYARAVCAAGMLGKGSAFETGLVTVPPEAGPRAVASTDRDLFALAEKVGLARSDFAAAMDGRFCSGRLAEDALLAQQLGVQKSGFMLGEEKILVDRDTSLAARFRAEKVALQDKARGLFWNAWVEPGLVSKYTPPPAIDPEERDLALAIDLSPLRYELDQTPGSMPDVSRDLRRAIDDWAGLPATDLPAVSVLLISDQEYFDSPPVVVPVTLHLDRAKSRKPLPKDGMAAGRTGKLDHVLGTVRARLHTRGRSGMASIAASVWIEGRPVDEFTVRACIGDGKACAGAPRPTVGFLRSDSYQVRGAKMPEPALALHFLERSPTEPVLAVLRSKKSAEPLVWRLGGTLNDFALQLSPLLQDLGEQAKGNDDQSLTLWGSRFADLLFPEPGARKAFAAAIAGASATDTLFVRVVAATADPPPILPLGLLHLGPVGFVGNRVAIETPLEVAASPSGDPACVRDWRFGIAPSGDGGEVDNAWTALQRPVGEARHLLGWKTGQAGHSYDTIPTLRTWLGTDENTADPIALLVLGHHADSRIWYRNSTDSVSYLDLHRKLKAPSAAILLGCGTSGSGARHLLRRLNQSGVRSAVATAANVTGDLAGAFLECFAAAVAKQSGDSLGHLQRAAVTCTAGTIGTSGRPFGSKALLFALVGEPSLRLCSPSP